MKILIVIGTLLVSLSCGRVTHNVKGVPKKLEVDAPKKVDINHNIKVDPSQFTQICKKELEENGIHPDDPSYQEELELCEAEKAQEFISILSELLKKDQDEEDLETQEEEEE